MAAELFRAVDAVEQLERKLNSLAAFSMVFHLLNRRIQFQEPGFAAMVETAVGLDLLARVRRVGGPSKHLAQLTEASLDAFPLSGIENQPARLEKNLPRTRRRASVCRLSSQFELQFAQCVSVFRVLLTVLR